MLIRPSLSPPFFCATLFLFGYLLMGIAPAGAQTLTPGKFAAGSNHSLAVNVDGTVRAWGYNNQGQLGNNTQTSTSVPVSVSGLTGATVVAGGSSHSLALKSDGTVRAWGYNVNGQLGNDSTTLSTVPVTVSSLSDVLNVACGANHSLAVKGDGTVWAWGLNTYGQLGDGSTTQRLTPVQVSALSGVVAVAAGLSHSYALKSDGTVWAWGLNENGQLGDSSTAQRLIPVQVNGLTGAVGLASGDNHGLVVKGDGAVWAWGYNNQGQLGDNTQMTSLVPVQVSGLTGVATVVGGSSHSAALMGDGTIRAWGYNDVGQLGNADTSLSTVPVPVIGLSGVSVIASGANHTMALKSDGSVWGAGKNNEGQLGSANSSTSNLPVSVSGINSVQSIGIGGGSNHILIVKSNGTVWSSGYNNNGQLGDNTQINSSVPVAVGGLTEAISVTAGASHSLAVKNDGTVCSWGSNSNGQLGDNSTTLSKVPVPVDDLTNVTAISAGGSHSLALKNDSTVWSWGLNDNGQLGNNSTVENLVPMQIPALADVVAVVAGSSHSLVLKSDGTVWAWGCNDDGQLGNNSTVQGLVPVQVPDLNGVIAIGAGSSHSLALKSDGTVMSWGRNNQGQLGNNTQTNSLVPVTISGLSNVVSLAGGGSHSLAMKRDGTVWSWGDNAQGQLGNSSTTLSMVPVQVSGMTGALAVAAGTNYSVVLKEDGMIATWGDSLYGQLAEGMSAYAASSTAIKVPAFNALHAMPSVAISSPVNNSVLAMGQTQTIDVTFTAAEGTPASVLLYHQGVLLGTDSVEPFSFSFQPWTYGDFSITALGIDSLGYDSLRSTAVNIKVPFDSDLDGLPDWWELRYFSTLSTSPSADGDSDGLNNLGEYISDNLPNDADKDSDNDGVLDAVEFAVQHNLLVTNLVSITANKTQRSVELSWQNNYANATSNIIQRSMDAGVTWSDAATVAATTTGYTVTGLQPGVNYQFRVLTASVYGSFPSNSITERTLLQKISNGGGHRLMIQSDNSLYASGINDLGQLGNNSTTSSLSPVLVNGLSNVVAVAAGSQHNLALQSDGSVRAWGRNDFGLLGTGDTINFSTPTPASVNGLTNIIAVSAGTKFSVALKSDGTVWSWGSNSMNQLGNNTQVNSPVPVQVSGLTNVVAVSCGYTHSLALKSDGTVWAWGRNNHGELGDNSLTSRSVPVQVSGLSNVAIIAAGANFSLALKTDGTVWAWGNNYKGQLANSTILPRSGYLTRSAVPLLVNGLSNVVNLSAGWSHSLAQKSDGTVWAWGENEYGQLGNNNKTFSRVPVPVSDLTGVISISAGGDSLAMKADGSLWSWGPKIGTYSPVIATVPMQVSGLSEMDVITAGFFHSLSLKNDGTVWSWGWNRDGGLGTGYNYDSTASPQPYVVAGLSNVVAISDSDSHSHSLAVKSDGTVWAWGKYNTTISLVPVQVSGITDVKAVSAGSGSCWALKNDGTVWTWATLSGLVPTQVNGLTEVVSISKGLALKSDGTVVTLSGVQVSGLTDVAAIAQGSLHSLAVKNDGTVWAWGGNSSGQLGNNSTTDSLVPVQVSGLDNVYSIAAGSAHSLAIKNDGTVWAWGGNASGQLGNNSTTNSLVPVQVNGLDQIYSVAAGYNHSLALKYDGAIAAWGDATYGQLGSGLMSDQITSLVPKKVRDVNLLHQLPSVEIVNPVGSVTLALGQPQTVEVTFTAAEGAPASVSFYHYGVLLGTDTTTPFTYTVEQNTWGDFPITAEGIDSLGVVSPRSAAVNLKVLYDDYPDFDYDGDGLPDWWEILNFTIITLYNGSSDIDSDSVSNLREYQLGFSPTDGDNNHDGINDGAQDTDSDGFSNGVESQFGTSPTDAASNPEDAGLTRVWLEWAEATAHDSADIQEIDIVPTRWHFYHGWRVSSNTGMVDEYRTTQPSLPGLLTVPASISVLEATMTEYVETTIPYTPSYNPNDPTPALSYTIATSVAGGLSLPYRQSNRWEVSWRRVRLKTNVPRVKVLKRNYLLTTSSQTAEVGPSWYNLTGVPTLEAAQSVSMEIPTGATVSNVIDAQVSATPGKVRNMELLPDVFVTKTESGGITPIDFCANGTAAPVIEAQVTACSINAAGVVTVGVAGTVTDATSDLIDTPAKQLQSLKVESPGNSQIIALINTMGGVELPWKPYRWGASFTATTSFATSGLGDFPVTITTDINAGGMAGSTSAYITVSQSTVYLELNNLVPDTVDGLRFYENTSTGGNEEIMTENAVDSRMFIFPQGSSNVGLKVEILSPTALTGDVDTIHVRFHSIEANGNDTFVDYDFIETGATTKQFTYSQRKATCQSFPKTDPGFFLPIMMRLPPLDSFAAENLTVRTMDHNWRLKKINFGNGEYFYLVDDEDKAVVFNPECYAHTHIQTKALLAGQDWVFDLQRAGASIGRAELENIDGLLVKGPVPDSFFRDSLETSTFTIERRHFEGVLWTMCHPNKPQNGTVPPVGHLTISDSVKPEILWRFVTAKNKIVFFNNFDELKRDVDYREKVVKTARAARFAYIGDGANVPDPKMNPVFWNVGAKMNSPIGPVDTDLKPGVTSYSAIENVFAFTNAPNPLEYNESIYATACQPGALLVCLRAISQTSGVSRLKFESVIGPAPFTRGFDLIQQTQLNEEDSTFWIPGDWGNLQNLDHNSSDSAQQGRDGENMIYLGGCFETELEAFKSNALFWGHGMDPDVNNIMKLGQMMQGISISWSVPIERVKVDKVRKAINHAKLSN